MHTTVVRYPKFRLGRGGAGGPPPPPPPLIQARNWRFKIIGSGLSDQAAISRFVLTFENGSTYTLSASETGAGAVANLEDGDPSTFWKTTSGFTAAYLLADLGVGVADTLIRIDVAQTNEVGAEQTHPAAFRIYYSTVAAPTEDDWIDYCVRLTQTTTPTTTLIPWPINEDCQRGVDYYLTPQSRWGFIVRAANTNGTLTGVEWRDGLGAPVGVVASHITRSAALNPALLYDNLDTTETSFEARAQPQLLATEFTAAIRPEGLELTGAQTPSASWSDIAVIAGPNDGNMQIITELLPVFTTPDQPIVVLPREPQIVQRWGRIHHRPGEYTAASWPDAIAYGGIARDLTQATPANRPVPASGPARLTFTNTGGAQQWMEATYFAVSGRSAVHLFRRPTVNWDGVTDGAGAPGANETKISGGAGGVKTLGVYGGKLFGQFDDFYIHGVGWGVDPLLTDLPQNTWLASIHSAAAASDVNSHKAARYGSGGASVDLAMILVLGDRDISKPGPRKQIERFIGRVIDAVEAA